MCFKIIFIVLHRDLGPGSNRFQTALNKTVWLQLLHPDDVVPGAIQPVRKVRTRATGQGRVRVSSLIGVHRTERRSEHGGPVRIDGGRVRVHAHPVDWHRVHTHVAVDAAVCTPAGSQVFFG